MADDQDFERAVAVVLEHEGGYVNDPADPGGETNFGISKRSYPDLDIMRLTRADAITIYRRDWWDRRGYAQLGAAAIAAKVFDLAVNMGHGPAVTVLQRACRACGRPVAEDGQLGPATIAAVLACDPAHLQVALRAEAAGRYRGLAATKPSLARFLPGWLNRAYR